MRFVLAGAGDSQPDILLDVLKRFVVDIWDDVAQLIYRQVAEVWAVVSVAKLMKIYLVKKFDVFCM